MRADDGEDELGCSQVLCVVGPVVEGVGDVVEELVGGWHDELGEVGRVFGPNVHCTSCEELQC